MGVYDSGGEGLEDGGVGADIWLAVVGFLEGNEARGDVDRRGEFVDFDELFPLLVVLGDDPFFGVAVRDGFAGAEGVHHLFAFEAESGFEGIVAVVEAGVDDLEGMGIRGGEVVVEV